MNSHFRFGKKRIEALPAPSRARVYFYDDKLPGLACCVTPAGNKTFYLCRRVNGRYARAKLGRFPEVTVEQARKLAQRLNGAVADGRDPVAERRVAREQPTFGDLAEAWLDHAKEHKRTWREDERLLDKFFKTWTGRQLNAISDTDVANLVRRVAKRSGPYQANRVLSLVRAMFNKCSKRVGYRGDNPTSGVERYREEQRDRFLRPDELPRFFTAVEQEPDPLLRDFFKVLLYTGARRGNVQSMAWQDIDLDARVWRIPQTKSGDPVVLPLDDAAVKILRARHDARDRRPYVFASYGRTGHLKEPKAAWRALLKRAKITDLRMHDLRRTLGSYQAINGASLPIIGKSLGHRNQASTAIYSRLTVDPIRESVGMAIDAIHAAAGVTEEGADDEQTK